MYSRNTHAKKGKKSKYITPGYSLAYFNDRSVNSGKILIRIRDKIKNISKELTQENTVSQSLSILVTNTKKQIGAGVIHTAQENVTPNK